VITRRRFLYSIATATAGFAAASLAACGGTTAPAAATSPAVASTPAVAAATKPAVASAVPAAPTTAATSAASAASGATAAPASKPAGNAVHVNFMFDSANLTFGNTYAGIADAFNKSQSAVFVDTQQVTADYNTQLLTQIAGGTPPDMFRYLQENIPIPALVAKKLGYAIDSFIARDKYDFTDFIPQAWALNVWQGKTYGVPRDYGNQQIYYNVEMFKAAGLQPIPADWTDTTWTFDAYLDAAKKLLKTENGKTTVWGCIVNRGWRPFASFVYSNGGAVVNVNADGLATNVALNSPAGTSGLQFLQDLIFKHKVAPRPEVESQEGPLQLFSSGKVGMILDNPSGAGNYRKSLKFTWDVGAIPVGQGGKRGSGGGGTAWAIAGPAKKPEQAWEFLKFLESPEQQKAAARAGVTTPSRKSVAHSDDFLQPSLAPQHSISFANAQEYVVRDPVHENWPQIQKEVVNKNMDSLWDGSKDAMAVATAIKAGADPLFKG